VGGWQLDFNWAPDVIDVDAKNNLFLITTDGTMAPFTDLGPLTTTSPFTPAIADAGFADDGSGVLTRITVEGNAAGIATLGLSNISMLEGGDFSIPVDLLNSALIAVSKDGPDAGTAIGDSPGERFLCDQDNDGVYDPSDNCPGVYNPTQSDVDSDSQGDACDPDAPDSDGDGIGDLNDACPDLPGVPARMGCPEPAVGGTAGLLDAGKTDAALPSSDDPRVLPIVFGLTAGAAALIAAPFVALRLRRRS
jgi:hypothetical protein